MKKLTTPVSREAILDLGIGDEVLITGTIVTARRSRTSSVPTSRAG
jgi:tartrate dehydratase beta subunit/fumarate hydratase class I family protein